MQFSKRLLWMLCFLLSTALVFAQGKSIKGKVTDAATGSPLTGITVTLKNSTESSITDVSGEFSIEANQSGKVVLVFTSVGYGPKEVTVSGNENITVLLIQQTKAMDEVVVVGYGTQKRANLTGAVSTVKADAFKDRPITNASQALAGQVPGVWVNQTSGQPGSDGATIRIRGIGTFGVGVASPLVLIDGIVASLSAVNPNDIETITVLKDAASSSIYGSRAANGVILIETKKGKKGPLQVDVNSYWGRQSATVLPKMVFNSVEVMELYNKALANDNKAPFYTAATIAKYKGGTDPLIYPNNDWIDIMINPATIQEHNVRLSGGKEDTRYAISLGYLDQDGIIMKDKAQRYTLNANLSSKVSDRFDWGIRTSLGNRIQNQGFYNGGTTGWLRELMRAMPYFGTYTQDGSYASTWVPSKNNAFSNPLAIVNNGLNSNRGNTLIGNVFYNFEIVKGLKWNVTAGINYGDNSKELFTPELFVYNPETGALKNKIGNGQRSLTNEYSKSLLTTIYSTLTYNKIFQKNHSVTILGGYNQEKFNDKFFGAYIEGFHNNSLTELDAGSLNKNVYGSSTAYGIRSYFGRLNYAYKNKYLLEANLRYDGSSRFSEDKRWGVFPSFSAGWRISEEAFMKDQNIFSNLKLRGSWGKVGNDQIGLYRWIPTLSPGQNYSFSDQVVGGIAQISLHNPNIKWETAKKTDIGLEAGFMQNRLNIEFDYFDEVRDGILRNLNIPWTVGGFNSGPATNLASAKNSGWEFNANYSNNINALKLSGGFNVTYVKNKIIKIPDPQIGFNILKEGEAINAFFMYKAIGIFQSQQEVDNSAKLVGKTTKPGDIKFEDISGPDGKPDGKITADDRQIVGKPIPTWTYGINLNAEYKGFDVGVLLQGVADAKSYVYSDEFIPFFNGAGVTTRWREGNTWTPDNPNAKLPRLLSKDANTPNYVANSFWLQDASYLRIKNIQLGYTFPERLSLKAGIKSVRLYVNAQNAFTFTKFEGLDPERSLTSQSAAQYPNVRVITAGVSLKF